MSTTEEADETPTIADVDTLTAWLDTQGLGVGAPLEHGYISGGSQNEIYELRRGDLHCAMRIPPPQRAGLARRGHRAGVAHHRGADRAPTSPTPRPSPCAPTRRCSAAPST